MKMHAYLNQYVICLGDFFRNIRKEGEIYTSKAAFLPISIDPLQMRVLRVHTRTNQLRTDLLEFRGSIAESNDLRRAYKSPIQRVEKEHDILPFVVAESHVLEGTVYHSAGLKIRSWFSYLSTRRNSNC